MSEDRVIDFRYAPPISWTAICRPDDPHKTLVSERGALLYDFQDRAFDSWTFRRVLEFGLRSAQGPLSVHQTTESARVPVVVTTLAYPHATLTLRSFGHADAEGHRTDVVLWDVAVHPEANEFLVMVKVDAWEQGTIFTGRSYAPAHVIFAATPENDIPKPDFHTVQSTVMVEDPALPAPGPVAFVSSPQLLRPAHPEGFRPGSAFGALQEIVQGGQHIQGAFMAPLNHASIAQLDYAWAENALAETRAFWNAYPLLALPFHVPDPAVMDMVTAAARNILQAREIKDGIPEFQVGATIYHGLWVVDGHFLLEAAQYLGYSEEAFHGLDALLRRVHDDGSIAQMPHHTKETGISLATLVRQCELTGRDDRLLELWPVIQRAVGFIEAMRAEAYALPTAAPNYRLIPDSFGDGGIGGKRAEYTTVFWLLAGLKAIAGAARRLGKSEDAARFQRDFDEFMADFRTCYARDVRTLADGTPYLPQWLGGSGDHHWIPNYPDTPTRDHMLQPQSATWALDQSIYPGEVFAPDDAIVTNLCRLFDQIDDVEGVPAETGWFPWRAQWNYDASFAAHVWLYAGRPDKAVDYLYAFANHATPTRVWREEQSFKESDNAQFCGDMPHNWASAEFIRLVRHLVVMERGDALDLLAGAPPEWLRPGRTIALERTPTRFGPVTVQMSVADDSSWVCTVVLDARAARRPSAIRLHLPEGAAGRITTPAQQGEVSGTVKLPEAPIVELHGLLKP